MGGHFCGGGLRGGSGSAVVGVGVAGGLGRLGCGAGSLCR